MIFELFPPKDGEAEHDREAQHVPERNRNTDDRVLALVKRQDFETVHDDGGRDSQANDSDTQRKSEPSDGSMPARLAHLNQARLQKEKQHPSVENGPVEPQDVGRSNLRMEKPGRHSGAEHHRDQNENEQRHAKIEVPVEYAEEACAMGTFDQTIGKRCGHETFAEWAGELGRM